MVTLPINAIRVDAGKVTLRLAGMSGEVETDSHIIGQFTKAELRAYIVAMANAGTWVPVRD